MLQLVSEVYTVAGQLKFDFDFVLNMGRNKNTYEVKVSILLITRNDRKK